jgi:hypothetical protein
MYDLVIRNGRIDDGSVEDAFEGDFAIKRSNLRLPEGGLGGCNVPESENLDRSRRADERDRI